MIDNPLQTIFGFIGPFYGLYLPLLIITILAIGVVIILVLRFVVLMK